MDDGRGQQPDSDGTVLRIGCLLPSTFWMVTIVTVKLKFIIIVVIISFSRLVIV